MQAPNVVRNNPNATVAALTIPCTLLATWLTTNVFRQQLSTEDGGVIGGGLACVALSFGGGIKRLTVAFAQAVSEYGIVGCCQRVWRGKPKT